MDVRVQCAADAADALANDLNVVQVVEQEFQTLTRGRVHSFDHLVAAARAQSSGHNDVLRAVPMDRDSLPGRDGALERIVLGRRQLRHVRSVHQRPANAVSTRVERSISATSTHSAAACASPMSPGP